MSRRINERVNARLLEHNELLSHKLKSVEAIAEDYKKRYKTEKSAKDKLLDYQFNYEADLAQITELIRDEFKMDLVFTEQGWELMPAQECVLLNKGANEL